MTDPPTNEQALPPLPIDPALICPVKEHRRFWKSAGGKHIVCAGCHPPAEPQFVEQWYDAGDREQTLIHTLSVERASRINSHHNSRIEGTQMEKTPYVKHSATSRQAAKDSKPSAGSLETLVYQFLLDRGDRGATDEEIQTALDLSGNSERPRRIALTQRGYVKDSGRERPTETGCPATVWVATGKKHPGVSCKPKPIGAAPTTSKEKPAGGE